MAGAQRTPGEGVQDNMPSALLPSLGPVSLQRLSQVAQSALSLASKIQLTCSPSVEGTARGSSAGAGFLMSILYSNYHAVVKVCVYGRSWHESVF